MSAQRRWRWATAAVAVLAVGLACAGVTVTLRGDTTDAGIDLVLTAVAVGLVGVLLEAMRHPPRIDVDVQDGELIVRPRGWDTLWCLTRSVTVPSAAVDSVTVTSVQDLTRGQPWRVWSRGRKGVAIPGLIRAGTILGRDGREFWDLRENATEVVRIDAQASAPYRRMVLQTPDPETTARTLRAAVKAGSDRRVSEG